MTRFLHLIRDYMADPMMPRPVSPFGWTALFLEAVGFALWGDHSAH